MLALCLTALASASSRASDHWYCRTIAAHTACSSNIQHTYAKNNVAYDGAALTWCEALVTPSGTYYSAVCTPAGSGGGYTIFGTWRDWCGYGLPGGCGWAVNGSTSLFDVADNQGSNTHSFRAHSYW